MFEMLTALLVNLLCYTVEFSSRERCALRGGWWTPQSDPGSASTPFAETKRCWWWNQDEKPQWNITPNERDAGRSLQRSGQRMKMRLKGKWLLSLGAHKNNENFISRVEENSTVCSLQPLGKDCARSAGPGRSCYSHWKRKVKQLCFGGRGSIPPFWSRAGIFTTVMPWASSLVKENIWFWSGHRQGWEWPQRFPCCISRCEREQLFPLCDRRCCGTIWSLVQRSRVQGSRSRRFLPALGPCCQWIHHQPCPLPPDDLQINYVY